jgi:hypothetical protein
MLRRSESAAGLELCRAETTLKLVNKFFEHRRPFGVLSSKASAACND